MQGTLPVRPSSSARRKRSRRRYIVGGLLLLLLFASAGAYLLLRPQQQGRQPSPEVVALANSYTMLDVASSLSSPFSWSPDGTQFVTHGDRELQLWEVRDERLAERSLPLSGAAQALWSPDGRTVAFAPPISTISGTITLLDAGSKEVLHSIPPVVPPDFPKRSSRNLDWVQVSIAQLLLGWSEDGSELVSLVGVTARDTEDAPGAQPEYAFYLGYEVWDAGTGTLKSASKIRYGPWNPLIYDVSLSTEGDVLAFATLDNPVASGYVPTVFLELWDVQAGRMKHQVSMSQSHPMVPGVGHRIAWSPDGATMYLMLGNQVAIMDAVTGQVKGSLPSGLPPTNTPQAYGMLPTATAYAPPLYNQPTFVPLPPAIPSASPSYLPPPPPPLPISTVQSAPVGPVPGMPPPAPQIMPDFLRPFFPPSAPPMPPTPTPDPSVYSPIVGIALSPSGDTLAVYDYLVIRLWDVSTGALKMITSVPQQSYPWYGGGLGPPTLTWTSDGKLLVVLVNSSTWLVDPDTGKTIRSLGRTVSQMAWSRTRNLGALYIHGPQPSWQIWGSSTVIP